MDWESRLSSLPKWALPAAGGGIAAGVYWVQKKRKPVTPITAPVAPIQQSLPSDSLPAYSGGAADPGVQYAPVNLAPITDALAQLAQQGQAQSNAFTGALAALGAAEQRGFDALAGYFNTTQPVTQPAQPAPPVVPPPPVSPLAPAAPAAPSTPAPSPAQPTIGQDWAALAFYLGSKSWHPGGLHFAGEPVQIRWKEPPYNGPEPGPPTGNYPTAYLPVNYNGDHDLNRYAWGVMPYAESTFIRTLRRTADYMSRNPSADPRTVWDGVLGRLMYDTGPINGSNWYNTGFDLGAVRNSPFLDGAGTPNPAWQDIY